MLAEMIYRPFEFWLNRGLAQSTTAQALARGLEGRTLRLTVAATPVDVRLHVTGGHISVGPADANPADAGVRGSALSLGRLLRGDPQAPVRDGSVQMTGDSEIAERFRELLRFATPDLEEELSRLVGDPIARQVGNATRAFAEWRAAAGQTVERSVAEYLQEESRLLPNRAEMEAFSRQVDALVNDVARAEARIERLKETL